MDVGTQLGEAAKAWDAYLLASSEARGRAQDPTVALLERCTDLWGFEPSPEQLQRWERDESAAMHNRR